MKTGSAVALAIIFAIPIIGAGFGIVFLMFGGIAAIVEAIRFRDRLSALKLIAFVFALPAAWFAWVVGNMIDKLNGGHAALTLVLWLYIYIYARCNDNRAKLQANHRVQPTPASGRG